MSITRIGECNKCGECCWIEGWKDGVYYKVVCRHLKDNGDGTFDCLIYDKLPKECQDFPNSKEDFLMLNKDYDKTKCSYKFEVSE